MGASEATNSGKPIEAKGAIINHAVFGAPLNSVCHYTPNPDGLRAVRWRDRPATGRRLARIPAGTPKTGAFPGPGECTAICGGGRPAGWGKGRPAKDRQN